MSIDRESWHLRKDVNVTTIFAIVSILVGGIWSTATMSAAIDGKVEKTDMVRVETQQQAMQAVINDIKVNTKAVPELAVQVRSLMKEIERERNDRIHQNKGKE